MDVNEIMKLIQGVSDYGLTSFELEEGNMRISLKREHDTVKVETIEHSGIPEKPQAGEEIRQAEPIGSDRIVTSPLVGVFYAASSPDSEPFVKPGDQVKKGQVLGIIEAMKLMNEIECEYDGVVEAILVKNEEVVEYGQPLFRIR